jgi:ArsR family transcriptional regulator
MKLDRIFKLVGDRTKLRILMLLDKGELCVCQVMAVLDVSQSLISKNMAKLRDGGFLDERREGKLVFYKIKDDLSPGISSVMDVMRTNLRDDADIVKDLAILDESRRFKEKEGRCDMETFKKFLEFKKRSAA